MHGNAWQWCVDRGTIGEGYDAKSAADDPTGPNSGDFRIVRGGSWHDGPIGARSSAFLVHAGQPEPRHRVLCCQNAVMLRHLAVLPFAV